MPVRLEAEALRPRVKHSTTEPLRSPDFPTVFKDWKLKKNTDLHDKILIRKRQSPLLQILVSKIRMKLWGLYLVQHMLHQIKAPQFYTNLGLQNSVESSC